MAVSPTRLTFDSPSFKTRPVASVGELQVYVVPCGTGLGVEMNLSLLQANIHLIENIKLFTEINKQIFNTIIERISSLSDLISSETYSNASYPTYPTSHDWIIERINSLSAFNESGAYLI